jgi:hypothetical protein
MANNVTRKITSITNVGTLIQAVFADLAAAIRVAQVGLDFTPKGALTNAVRVGENQAVMIFNSAGAVGYVSFGSQSMGAPTGPTDGIPVAAGEKIVLSSGSNAWVRGSAATIFGYVGDL